MRCASAFLAVAVVASGCGYAPVRGRSVEGLRVAPVKNATAQAEAGGIFATELRHELAGRGRLEPDGSQAKGLQAELGMLRSLPRRVRAGGGGGSYRLGRRVP